MILQADLRSQPKHFELPSCSIDKVVELSPAEYAEFTLNTISDYDFIHDFNQEKHLHKNDLRSCLLVLGENEKDGILIDPQGYNYARYTAYLPNARSLVEQEQYSSLAAHADEMRWLTEKYVQKALVGQLDCQYRINLIEARNLCRQTGYTDELFIEMLSERKEFEDVEQTDESCFVTIAEPYLRQENEKDYKKLTPKEVDIMCAKHILWLNDAGGEQADFSNCLLNDLDLSHRNFNNAVFNDAKFTNTRLCGAEMCFAVLNNAKFYNCDLSDAIAEEAEFKGVESIGSDFSRGTFTHSDFAGARFRDCDFNYVNMQSSCIEGTELGDLNLSSVNLKDCSYDEQEWTEETLGQNISM